MFLRVVELRSPRTQGPPSIWSSGKSLWHNSVGQESSGQLRRSVIDGRSQVAIDAIPQPDKIAALRVAVCALVVCRRLRCSLRDRLLLCQMRRSAEHSVIVDASARSATQISASDSLDDFHSATTIAVAIICSDQQEL